MNNQFRMFYYDGFKRYLRESINGGLDHLLESKYYYENCIPFYFMGTKEENIKLYLILKQGLNEQL